MSQVACAFTGIKGEMIALKDVSVSVVLRDLLADVKVSQTYRNDESANIEAVYTFPLPLDALLLEFEICVGNRHLKGTVVEKRAAERRYEEAIESGDAAVMLEQLEPGLFTMNVGNLLPQEIITVTFRYSMLLRWTGNQLRIMLPTTIAARYGNSPHMPHQSPVTSLFAENKFSITVEVFGALQNAQFNSPSHEMELIRSSEKTTLALNQERAAMDRDFVLNVRAPQAQRNFLLTGRDGSGLAALASFQPFFPGLRQNRPLNIALVIDCSGSMQGDSIAQARNAVERILESLAPSDRFTIVKFGNTTETLWERLKSCTRPNRDVALRFAQTIQASMGGTEIGNALSSAYGALENEEASDILLVTDGEVSAWQPVVDLAQRSGHRIFTVGVGNAVSEAFVRALASQTGGECELVSPREDMAERILRHFERIRSPRAKRVKISWPGEPIDQYPSEFRTAFDGDTVIGFARFLADMGAGRIVLEAELEEGEALREELVLASASQVHSGEDISIVARMVAHARLRQVTPEEGRETAIRYGLLSPWTNWIAVVDRPKGQSAIDIPAIRKVPQTLAAGSILHSTRALMMPAFAAAPRSSAPPRHPGKLFQSSDSIFSSLLRLGDEEFSVVLARVESKGMPTMVEFLTLLSEDDWNAIVAWLSMKGQTSLVQKTSEFRGLLRSHGVADLTERQVLQGMEVLIQAAKLGFRLSRAILKEAGRLRLL